MKFEIPEQKKLVFEMQIPIRWGDMDAMKHVNNTSYFRYLETCRIDWMQSIACAPDSHGEGPVIVNAFCNFYQCVNTYNISRTKCCRFWTTDNWTCECINFINV